MGVCGSNLEFYSEQEVGILSGHASGFLKANSEKLAHRLWIPKEEIVVNAQIVWKTQASVVADFASENTIAYDRFEEHSLSWWVEKVNDGWKQLSRSSEPVQLIGRVKAKRKGDKEIQTFGNFSSLWWK